ncbi:MAG: hypothetical protein HONBIEJF_01000 [Fimbriimonadaceae bacterium]|nr:hypothetical protein [Fimbriimonadaceae bacterium]
MRYPLALSELEYSFDSHRIDFEKVVAWLRDSYWSPKIRPDVLRKAFANSIPISAIHAEHGQVGFARAVTDHATFGWIADVYVEESFRGRGIGKELVRRLMEHPDLTTLRRWVLATRDAQEVYRALGFEDVPLGRFMIYRADPLVWQDLPVE